METARKVVQQEPADLRDHALIVGDNGTDDQAPGYMVFGLTFKSFRVRVDGTEWLHFGGWSSQERVAQLLLKQHHFFLRRRRGKV